MLTRLQVSGFKNLVDVDVRFGTFTCIAGTNGVGKSNLFDAIRFLSALADRPFVEAAKSVRDESGRTGDVRSLFHRVGDNHDDRMDFELEMIIPNEGADDLGQTATAGMTFLRYSLTLAYRGEKEHGENGSLELLKEELVHINKSDVRKHLLFNHSKSWRESIIRGRRAAPYISTEETDTRIIKLHQDGTGGIPLQRSASHLPRTVLSTVHAAESPTALLARREMQSWRLLQLEPSSLRKPDEFSAPTRMGQDGSHLPATLYRLARNIRKPTEKIPKNGHAEQSRVYAQVAERLAQLINDVRKVGIDRDEKRELLTVQITDADATTHPARALSDGTLRFLALAVLEMDSETQELICLEEPENGIHPERIPAMLQLLKDIASDVDVPVGPDNPLRQVIINTHSPAVVSQVADGDLVVAESKETVRPSGSFKRVAFSCLSDTWRAIAPANTPEVSKGTLLTYLNPVAPLEDNHDVNEPPMQTHRRVIDRDDFRPLFAVAPYGDEE